MTFRQAVDTFLKSPQCKDIKKLSLFEKEWDVLSDFALILVVAEKLSL
jgi:hypothetical protein